MGKAGRWLRSFLGAGKQPVEEEAPEKDKKRWPLCRSARVPEKPPEKKVVVEMRPVAEKVVAERLRSRREFDRIRKCDDDCTNRNKHAVAVAAATAAVAEAAVAAAKAAAAVVQLTRGGSNLTLIAGSGGNGDSAATRIQAAFRGYLARRALRALKALVKVQALVRGYIVRKQAARTLRCMQALVRVQARARQNRFHRFDGTPLSLSHRQRYKNASKLGEPAPVYDRGAPRSWLDRWVDINHERSQNSFDDETPKVLEVDPGKPLFVTRHKSKSINSRSLSFIPTTAYSDPVKGSTIPLFPSPSSSVDMPLRLCVCPEEDEFESSPLSLSTSSQKLGRFEYAQSELGGCRDYPNYMSNTESWRGKARSRSAPRSRAAEFEKCGSAQRVQADGLTDARSCVSPVLSQRSSSLRAKFTSKAYPGSGRLDRLGMPVRARG